MTPSVVVAKSVEQALALCADGFDVIRLDFELPEVHPWRFFSASQVDTFLSCRRKWAWRYVAKIRSPEGASAMLGTAVHLQLENYLGGKGFDYTTTDQAGYIGAAGIQHLPEPNTEGMRIEREFRFLSPRSGLAWTGRKDLTVEDRRKVPNIPSCDMHEDCLKHPETAAACTAPIVTDHKSTGDLRWAKSAETLKWDPQGVLYGYEEIAYSRSPVVDLAWVYYQTKGSRTSKRTHLRMVAEHAVRAFGVLESVGLEMAAVHANTPSAEDGPPDLAGYVRSLPPTVSACRAYGGCPYEHACGLTHGERLKANMSNNGSGLLDTLLKRAEAQDAAGPVVQETPSVMGMSDRDVPAPSTLPGWMTQPPVADPINPPESMLPPPVVPPPIVAAPPAAEEPKKRSRKPRAEKDPLGADAHAATITTTTAHANEDAAAVLALSGMETALAVAKAKLHEIREGFTLYVDCIPILGLGAPVLADDYIARAKNEITSTDFKDAKGETIRYADYRFIPWGQGAGALVGAVLAEIEKDPPNGGAIVLSTLSPEGRDILAPLMAKASAIVRGI